MMQFSFNHYKTQLPNGLRVSAVPLKTTGAVTVLVLVGAGSRYESGKNNGVAHFLEHLFFKGGRRHQDTKAVSETLDGVGADFNAFTSSEYAGYYVKLASGEIELAFDVLSDMLLHARLPQKEIDKERGVILEEYRMINDTPMRKIGDVFEELVFAGSPMGFSTIGKPEVIKRLGKKEFINYRRELYTPDNIVVAVAGDLSPAQTLSLARKYFRFPPGKKTLTSSLALTPDKPGLELIYKETDQAHLILGAPAFSVFDPRRHALRVLATVLGGGMSSRMFLTVREKHSLAYYIHTDEELYTDAGYLATASGVGLGKIEKAIKLILKEYFKIARFLVNPRELRKAKERIKGHLVLNLESSSNVAGYFALQELLLKSIETPSQRLKAIEEVSASEVREVARALFGKANFQLALIGPYNKKGPLLKLLQNAGKNLSAH